MAYSNIAQNNIVEFYVPSLEELGRLINSEYVGYGELDYEDMIVVFEYNRVSNRLEVYNHLAGKCTTGYFDVHPSADIEQLKSRIFSRMCAYYDKHFSF